MKLLRGFLQRGHVDVGSASSLIFAVLGILTILGDSEVPKKMRKRFRETMSSLRRLVGIGNLNPKQLRAVKAWVEAWQEKFPPGPSSLGDSLAEDALEVLGALERDLQPSCEEKKQKRKKRGKGPGSEAELQ